MKFVKLSIFALSMGLFVASCGDNASEETTTTDSTMMTTPAPEATPAPMDTTMAMPADSAAATTDTTHAAH